MEPLDRNPVLDGIRGLAILLVLVLHGSFIVALEHPPGIYLQRIMRTGWIGVDLFFVLSGFLITTILFKCRGRLKNISHFYLRRALRILPLYYGLIAILFVAIPLFIDIRLVPGYFYLYKHQIWFWLYVQNFLFAKFGRLATFPYVQHLWSLAIEEQFYLIWPAAVYFLSDRALKSLCVAGMIGCLTIRVFWLLNGISSMQVYVHTLARVDTLMYGGYLALIMRSPDQLLQWTRWSKKIIWPLAALLSLFIIYYPYPLGAYLVQSVGYSFFGMMFCSSYSARTLRILDRPCVRHASAAVIR